MSRPFPAADFPRIEVPRLGGGALDLSTPESGRDWRMIVVYRGEHCPICARYLKGLEGLLSGYREAGVDVAVVSADPEEKARRFAGANGLTMPVGYGLTPEQMGTLGLYVSDPRSAQETDRPFAEPALFVINAAGRLQIVDLSNAPFARPDLEQLLAGIRFVREKDYPVRGARAA